jgi:hypothetical protein
VGETVRSAGVSVCSVRSVGVSVCSVGVILRSVRSVGVIVRSVEFFTPDVGFGEAAEEGITLDRTKHCN